jgi:hypothetical protein
VTNWAHVSARPTYILPNGDIIAADTEGKMPTGSYCTTLGNSIIRCVLSKVAGSAESVSMGDDTLDWHANRAEFERRMSSFELVIRDVRRNDPKSFTFCSHLFSFKENEWRAELLNIDKMFYAYLADGRPGIDRLVGLLNELNHSDRRKEILEYVTEEIDAALALRTSEGA